MTTTKKKKVAKKKKATKKKRATKKTAPKVEKKNLTIADSINVHCACDDIVKIDKLKPFPGNANLHPDDQVALLAKLILGHGWRGPITISNLSGMVVRGHGRLQAAKLLEVSEVPVDFQDYDSDSLERADRLADNRIQELSEWDRDLLKEELIGLDSGILKDMDLTGFDSDSMEDLLTAAPPPDFKPEDGSEDGQPSLDKTKTHTCPACGHEWQN